MAVTTVTYGARTEFANDSNLNSLGSTSLCAIGPVDNSGSGVAGADAFIVDFSISLASSSVSSTGTLTAYLIQSSVSTSSGFTDGISPTGASVTVVNAKVVYVANANTNSQVVADTFRLPVPDPAKYWSLVWLNGSGAALKSSANSVYYLPITYTTQ
jgi:hypothetical protein